MKTKLSLTERIQGCLLGAAIGAELGWARRVDPAQFKAVTPSDLLRTGLKPNTTFRQHPQRIN